MFLNHRDSSGFRRTPPSFCVYFLPSPTIFHLISHTVTNYLVVPLLSSPTILLLLRCNHVRFLHICDSLTE
ncbi:Uncharacterized protein APZ42_005394, partial [Daphnia magna]